MIYENLLADIGYYETKVLKTNNFCLIKVDEDIKQINLLRDKLYETVNVELVQEDVKKILLEEFNRYIKFQKEILLKTMTNAQFADNLNLIKIAYEKILPFANNRILLNEQIIKMLKDTSDKLIIINHVMKNYRCRELKQMVMQLKGKKR